MADRVPSGSGLKSKGRLDHGPFIDSISSLTKVTSVPSTMRQRNESDEDNSSMNSADSPDDSSSSSCCSSSSSSSASSSASASDGDNEDGQRYDNMTFLGTLTSLRRRNFGHSRSPRRYSNDNNNDDDVDQPKHRKPWRRNYKYTQRKSYTLRQTCSALATLILCTSVGVWIGLLAMVMLRDVTSIFSTDSIPHVRLGSDQKLIKGPRKDKFDNLRVRVRPKKKNMEDLTPGCLPAEWQTFNFPNCNDLHEIDPRSYLKKRYDPEIQPSGFIADGHWRTVWAVQPRSLANETLVLKVMKSEHDVNDRNFDRHRRDALVMERLTSSLYVVNIYGFCGNTVLTEHIPRTLPRVVENATTSYPTRNTPEGRIRLMLDTARGIKALHTIPGGPIVHADVTPKQFLVADDGRVKVNDFNRCRFVAHLNGTDQTCPFRIPSSPGKSRSPEEYDFKELSEKLDIFSIANVFHYILTAEDPWDGWSSAEVKKKVTNGFRPYADEPFRTPGTTDESLQQLILRAYELDPKKRISASELVAALEALL